MINFKYDFYGLNSGQLGRGPGASCTKLFLPHLSENLRLSDHLSWLCKIWYISYGKLVTYIDGSRAVCRIGLNYSTNLSK